LSLVCFIFVKKLKKIFRHFAMIMQLATVARWIITKISIEMLLESDEFISYFRQRNRL
jgi:hypothetical protein